MKGLFSWVGFKQTGIPYIRETRFAGRTKWNYWRLWNFAIEGITSISYLPLQLSIYIGFFIAFIAFIYASFLVIRTFIFGRDVPGYESIMVVILFLGGVQIFFLGIIGEYLGRLFNQAKNRPLYLINDIIGINKVRDLTS
jgi:glycosyltransferase involved in cell wall biosynthesis